MVYLFLVLMVLSNAGETIAYKCTKNDDSISITYGVCLWSFILSIPALIVALIVEGVSIFDHFNWASVGYIALLTAIGIFNIISWVIASKNMPMSIAEGVSEIYIAFLTLFSWILFGWELSVWQIVLVSVVIVACIALAFLQDTNRKRQDNQNEENSETTGADKKIKYNYKLGFIFLFLWIVAAVIRGLIPGAVAQTGLNSFVYSFILNAMMLAVSIALMLVKKKNIVSATKAAFRDPWIVAISVCRLVSQLIILYLAMHMNLGVVDAVSVFGLVIIMLYERLIMKEKVSWYLYVVMLVIAIATAALCVI